MFIAKSIAALITDNIAKSIHTKFVLPRSM